MSELYRPAFADPHYGLIFKPNVGYVLAAGPGTPAALSAPAAGYAKGCLFLDTTDSIPYKNVGDTVTAVWEAIIGVGDVLAALNVTALTVTSTLTLPDGSILGADVVTVAPATTTLTLTPALHGGKTLNIASTGGLAITPPAATGTGIKYRFACSAAITGGSFTVDAKAGNASDVVYGAIQSYKATTYTPYDAAPVTANANLITLNGSTTGGAAIGDWFEMLDVATHVWLVTGGFLTQSGTIATPFSNH